MNIWFSLLIIATVWFVVYILCKLFKVEERFGWSYGLFFLLMRTKKFNDYLRKISKKHANFWRIIGNISIFVGFIAMFISFGLFTYTLVDFFLPDPVITDQGAAVGLIIPGVTISFKTTLYLILPLFLTIIPHEIAHGVVTHADGVELKSTGLLFFLLFFGAFVEPDEEDVMDSSPQTKMRTFAAGIFPNLMLGLITIPFLVFSSSIHSPLYYPPDGVLIQEVVTDSPAADSELTRGTAIYAINNTHLSNLTVFSEYMGKTKPNDLLLLNTTKGQISVRLITNPNNDSIGYLGVKTIPYQRPKVGFATPFFPAFYTQQAIWLIVIAFGAVLLNILPIPIMADGDKLLSTFLVSSLKNKKLALIILDIFRFLALALFLTNIILPIVKFGLVPL
ncbi:MAG: site-2 protease family protein [Asgard group archaeon]|nr:site-2 protease family protein [Asgard group archaeon]